MKNKVFVGNSLRWGSRRLWALVLRAKRRVFRDKQQLTEMREQSNAIAIAGNSL
jgi:hypothetical protein